MYGFHPFERFFQSQTSLILLAVLFFVIVSQRLALIANHVLVKGGRHVAHRTMIHE